MQAAPVTAVVPKNPGNAAQSTGVDGEAADGLSFSALFKAQVKGGQGSDKGVDASPDAEAVDNVLANVVARQDAEFLPGAEMPANGSLMALAGGQRITRADELKEQPLTGSLVPLAGDPRITQAEDASEQPLSDSLIPTAQDRRMAQAEDAREQALNDGFIPVVGVFAPLPAVVVQQAKYPVPNAVVAGKALEGIKSAPDAQAQFDKKLSKVNAAYLGSDRGAEFAADGKMLPQGRLDKNGEGLFYPVSAAEPQRVPESPVNALPVMVAANPTSVADTKALLHPPAALHTPVGASGWSDALGQKLVWMAGQQTQVAELHLNPAHLGPMEVRLSVSNDQISAIFVSHQPAVREAIEAAMPRLREMLADGGLNLGSATVSSDSLPQQQSSGREGSPGASRQTDLSDIGNMRPSINMGGVVPLRHDGSGMVDLFA